ncbi:chemotaxis protein CheW [Catenovulum sediminis]|uniref:Chemotaxis protein CheW n=1 Tax=Catenovulum sediminis TaxID=1740262 RepID=A0ABV1RHK2_9ALTE
MSKGAFANEDVMEEYLDALLTEDVSESVQLRKPKKIEQQLPDDPYMDDVALRTKHVEELLKKVAVTPEIDDVELEKVEPKVSQPVENLQSQQDTQELSHTQVEVAEEAAPVQQRSVQLSSEQSFQALFFEVAGLTLAVPLTELGGIHNLTEVSPLFGKPDWFKGLMIHREQKINVVDSALWVMPEKYDEKLATSLNYQYLIMLGDSNWGLSCETLINTVTLNTDDVKWRVSDGKRPWLAGLVKEKMCALLDVGQLIELLNKGLNSLDDI